MQMDKMWSLANAWILAAVMAAMWIYPKLLAGLDVHPVMGLAEARSGVSWFEPGLRYLTGVLVALSAILLLFRKTRVAGAVGALAISLFYIILHSTPWLGTNIPDYGALMAALEAGRTAEQIDALGLATDYAGHMVMTFTTLTLAGIVLASEFGIRRAVRQEKEAKEKPRFAFS